MTADIAMLGIGVDSTGLKQGGQALDEFARKGKGAEDAANRAGKAADFLTRMYKDLAKALAAYKVLDLIKESAMLAARFETMGVVMGVAGNNAGYTRKEMFELEKQLTKTGISMIKAREVLTSLATANIDLSKASRLARAAQDLAVVANVNSSDAMARMVHGIKSGETEVLKTLGLNVSFENSYKKLAAQLGVNKDALTEQQKVMARTNAVLDESTKYAGIYEESMTTAGKAITSLSRYWEDLKVKMGEAFLPALAEAVFRLTDGLKAANAELDKAGSEGLIDRIGRGLNMAFKTVYETVVVLGANVGYVFTMIGNEIGGMAAQVAAILRGDFAGARDIGRQMVADAEAGRKAIDAFSASVIGGASASQQAAQAAQGDADAKERQRMATGAASRAAEAAEEKRLKAAEAAAKAAKKAASEAETARKRALEYIADMNEERQAIGATEQQTRMLAAAREAAKAPTMALKLQIMETALALTVEKQAYEDAEESKRKLKEANDAHVKSLADELQGVIDLVAAEKLAVETYGMSAAAITRHTIAKLESKRASLAGVEGTELEVRQIEELIKAHTRLEGFQNKKLDLDEMLDPGKAESWGDAIKKAMTGAADSIAGVGNALGDYILMQEQAERDRKKATLEHAGDAQRLQKALDKINKKERADSLSSYAEMAGASKKFFKEHTAAYKTLDAIEKAFHAWKMVSMATEFAQKMGLITAETAAVITGQTTVTAGAVASGAVQTAAATTTASANALAAVANQGNGDPYSAFFRIAAMAAIMAGLGLMGGKSAGGGQSVSLAAMRQGSQGTGSVLGDEGAKSQSLANSLELLADNSNIALEYSSGMLATLRSINDGIAGMAASVARSSGLRGTKADQRALGVGASKSALGFGSKSTELVDSGIYFDRVVTGRTAEEWGDVFLGGITDASDGTYGRGITRPSVETTRGQRVGEIMAGGVNARSYADLHHEKSSWWGLSKSSSDSTVFGNIDNDLKAQLTLSIGDMYSGVIQAARGLGVAGADLEATLQNVELGFDRISLMGLSGDDLANELQAVLSSVGDDMAARAVPAMLRFQRVGEGAFETLVRVANGVEVAQYELERFGLTAVDYSTIANRAGDIDAEIVRQTIVNAQRAGDALSGVGQMMLTLDGSAADLASTYADLLAVQQSMIAVGVDPSTLNRSMVRGARDISTLQSGLDTYNERAFSDAERAASLTRRVQGEFARLGVTAPTTWAGLRQLVGGIDKTTEAGATLFGQVMSLVGGFEEMVDAIETANPAIKAKSPRELLDEAFDFLQRTIEAQKDALERSHRLVVDGINAQIKAAQDGIAKTQRLASSLNSTLDRMRAPGMAAGDRLAAQGQIGAALAIAKAGGMLPDADALAGALSVVSSPAEGLFASFEDYQADFYATALQISELASLSDAELTVEQRALEVLQDQLKAAEQAYENELARLDSIVAAAQAEIDRLDGIREVNAAGFAAVVAAVEAFNAASRAAGGSGTVSAAGAGGGGQAVGGVPAGGVGIVHNADGSATAYFPGGGSHNVSGGADNYATLVETYPNLPRFLNGGNHAGGWRVAGEVGPEVEFTGHASFRSNAQSRRMLDMQGLEAEVKGMRGDMFRVLYQIAKNTGKGADLLEKFDYDGMPETRDEETEEQV